MKQNKPSPLVSVQGNQLGVPSPPLGARYSVVGFDATNSIYINYEQAKVKAN